MTVASIAKVREKDPGEENAPETEETVEENGDNTDDQKY